MTGIGLAIEWQIQARYLTKTRLVEEGKAPTEIDLSYKDYIESLGRLKQKSGYERYRNDDRGAPDLMLEAGFGFVERNFLANASEDYKNLHQPVLILLGEHNLNVDVNETRDRLTRIFRHRNNMQINIIPNASHGLLKAEAFSQQVRGQLLWLKLMWAGKSALAPGFSSVLSDWIVQLETIHYAKKGHEGAVSYLRWRMPLAQ